MLQNVLYSVATLCLLGGALAGALLVADRLLLNYGPCAVDVNEEETLMVEGGCSLMDALYEHEIFIPSGCGGQGTCGHCKVTVLSGGGPVPPTELPLLSRQEVAGGVRLACQVKVKEDLRLRVPEEYFDIRRFEAEVESASMVAPEVREIRLRLLEPERIEFSPGQYVQVEVPTREGTVHRAYSIASSPDRAERIDLVVRRVPGGTGSTYLHEVRGGDRIAFTGPYGEFELSPDPQTEIVCVAGGCGIAPIKSIVQYVCARWPERPCRLFFGVRTRADVFYREWLDRLRAKHPNFEVHLSLSEPGEHAGWEGETGFIHRSVERHLGAARPRQAFLCGPEPMIEAAEEVLKQKGVPDDAIYYDSW
ncbi:MAG: NADH:ubiquinone reductase (Na(+)-transporting) subunit F [Planctomycetota bacterium]